MSSSLTTIIIAVGLLAVVVAAILVERSEFNTWQSRLVWPDFKQESINRHTPLHPLGTVLPPTITADLTLTSADNPIILVRETVVAPGATLTLRENARLFTHEFSQLSVEGRLVVQGTPQNRIQLTTNEVHPDNQLWNGIILKSGSHAEITHATIQFASPALTCLKNSSAAVTQAEIFHALIGVFSETPSCVVTDSRIQTERAEHVRTF